MALLTQGYLHRVQQIDIYGSILLFLQRLLTVMCTTKIERLRRFSAQPFKFNKILLYRPLPLNAGNFLNKIFNRDS